MDDKNELPLQPRLGDTDGILFLDGYMFMKNSLIEQNDEIVQKTFKDLYKYVSSN
jgi:hypothetical protein